MWTGLSPDALLGCGSGCSLNLADLRLQAMRQREETIRMCCSPTAVGRAVASSEATWDMSDLRGQGRAVSP